MAENEGERMLEALVRFVDATEALHDAVGQDDPDLRGAEVLAAIQKLYDARNIVHDLLAEDEAARDGDVEPLNDRRTNGTSSRLYQGSCPMGHAFKGELTGPETPDTFVMECPVTFCGVMEMQANAL